MDLMCGLFSNPVAKAIGIDLISELGTALIGLSAMISKVHETKEGIPEWDVTDATPKMPKFTNPGDLVDQLASVANGAIDDWMSKNELSLDNHNAKAQSLGATQIDRSILVDLVKDELPKVPYSTSTIKQLIDESMDPVALASPQTRSKVLKLLNAIGLPDRGLIQGRVYSILGSFLGRRNSELNALEGQLSKSQTSRSARPVRDQSKIDAIAAALQQIKARRPVIQKRKKNLVEVSESEEEENAMEEEDSESESIPIQAPRRPTKKEKKKEKMKRLNRKNNIDLKKIKTPF
jgi:hypothetical protein